MTVDRVGNPWGVHEDLVKIAHGIHEVLVEYRFGSQQARVRSAAGVHGDKTWNASGLGDTYVDCTRKKKGKAVVCQHARYSMHSGQPHDIKPCLLH